MISFLPDEGGRKHLTTTNGTILTDVHAGENVIATHAKEGLGIELDRDAVTIDTESPLIDELVDAATSGDSRRHAFETRCPIAETPTDAVGKGR